MYYTGKRQISKKIDLIFLIHYKADAEIELLNYANLAFNKAKINIEHWPVSNEQEAFDLLYDAILDAFESESYSDNEVGILAAEVYLTHLGYAITNNKEIVAPGIEETLNFLKSYDYTISKFPY